VLVPLAQGLIEATGWAGALLALAALCALGLACVRPIQDTPAPTQAGQPRLRTALAEAASVRGFWLLNAGFLVCGFQLAFIASHLPAYLLDQGLGAAEAVRGLALIALANVAGTWVWGWLGVGVRAGICSAAFTCCARWPWRALCCGRSGRPACTCSAP
jgi:cyanate permease